MRQQCLCLDSSLSRSKRQVQVDDDDDQSTPPLSYGSFVVYGRAVHRKPQYGVAMAQLQSQKSLVFVGAR